MNRYFVEVGPWVIAVAVIWPACLWAQKSESVRRFVARSKHGDVAVMLALIAALVGIAQAVKSL